jgi:hypothetical protein
MPQTARIQNQQGPRLASRLVDALGKLALGPNARLLAGPDRPLEWCRVQQVSMPTVLERCHMQALLALTPVGAVGKWVYGPVVAPLVEMDSRFVQLSVQVVMQVTVHNQAQRCYRIVETRLDANGR